MAQNFLTGNWTTSGQPLLGFILADSKAVADESLERGPQIGADWAAARPVPKLPQHAGVGDRSARRPGSLMPVFS